MSRLMASAVGSVAFAGRSLAVAGVLKAIDLLPPELSRDDLLTWAFSVALNVVATAMGFAAVTLEAALLLAAFGE